MPHTKWPYRNNRDSDQNQPTKMPAAKTDKIVRAKVPLIRMASITDLARPIANIPAKGRATSGWLTMKTTRGWPNWLEAVKVAKI